MATHSLRLLMAASVAAVAYMGANAQEQPKQKKNSDFALHGSVQADVLFPEADEEIGLKPDKQNKNVGLKSSNHCLCFYDLRQVI